MAFCKDQMLWQQVSPVKKPEFFSPRISAIMFYLTLRQVVPYEILCIH